MNRKALGRGLSALIREVEVTEVAPGSAQIQLAMIDPNPFQPRRSFAEDDLRELADSIRAQGLIQPVVVRKSGARYQLVVGERRWRAARLAGLESVPAMVRDVTDREALELALTENLLRNDLNPIEVAKAYLSLQEHFHLSHEDIAERIGINRATVSNTLRLLRLPQVVQDMVTSGGLNAGHARALLGVDDADSQIRLAKAAVKRGLSVRQVEKLVSPKRAKPQEPGILMDKVMDPNIRAATLELERALGTRVRITGDGKQGKVEISYFSGEDLNRIYGFIVGPQNHNNSNIS